MERVVQPEILDHLETVDPRAVRSRKDLQRINRFMRGEEWIVRQISRLLRDKKSTTKIIELGAGEGTLSKKMHAAFPECEVVALDLVERPVGLDSSIQWVTGDLLEYQGFDENSIVVANLMIHHFESDQLKTLGEYLSPCMAICFAEPYRSRLALAMGYTIFPFIGEVTRHDMIVSIKAGFDRKELAEWFGNSFVWSEEVSVFGGLRSLAVSSNRKVSVP